MKCKKIFSLILVALLMVPFIVVNANAESIESESQDYVYGYEDLCIDYKYNHSLYTVYDKDNNDISDLYYTVTRNMYASMDIDAIFEYSMANVSRITRLEIEDNNLTRGSLKTVKKTETFYDSVNNVTGINDYDIAYTLSGQITYNMNTGKISSYSSPVFNLTYVSINGLVSGTARDISTNAELVSNGYKVKFSCRFNMKSTLYAPAGSVSVPVREEVTGPYSGEFLLYGT